MGMKIGGGRKPQLYDDSTGRYGGCSGHNKSVPLTSGSIDAKVISIPKENFDLNSKSEYSKSLIEEVKKHGKKISEDRIVAIGKRTSNRKIYWLELGNKFSGIEHIRRNHLQDYINIGVPAKNIVSFIMNTVINEKPISIMKLDNNFNYQYKISVNGKDHYFRAGIGSNGYIVNMFPNDKSMKKE